jgi:hypothetical protein
LFFYCLSLATFNFSSDVATIVSLPADASVYEIHDAMGTEARLKMQGFALHLKHTPFQPAFLHFPIDNSVLPAGVSADSLIYAKYDPINANALMMLTLAHLCNVSFVLWRHW